MEPETLFYIVLAVFWLLSQLASVGKKSRERGETRPSPPPPPPPPPSEDRGPERQLGLKAAGRDALQELRGLKDEVSASLEAVDERVRAQAALLVEASTREEAPEIERRLEDALSSGDAGRMADEIEGARSLLGYVREVVATAELHADLRRRSEARSAQAIADRLTDDFGLPFHSFAETALGSSSEPAPVAVVWNLSSGDRLARTPLTGSTLFVPRSVATDPLHWSLVPQELSRYLASAAPGLYQELYEELDLRVTESQLAGDPDALTRLLFASWLGRLVSDVVGASFYGPSYLAALARQSGDESAPQRVTTIYLQRDGTVHPEPPAHVRVHVVADWLALMGYSAEAEELARAWDERHGSPEALRFHGSRGSLDVKEALATTGGLAHRLYHLEMDALAGRKLSQVPGLSDWDALDRKARAAKEKLIEGAPASAPPRALVSAAMAAAVEAPERSRAIRSALYDSLGIGARPLPARGRAPIGRKRIRRRGPFAASARDVAEALVLGEILLERPRKGI